VAHCVVHSPTAYTSVKVPFLPYCRYSGAMKPGVPLRVLAANRMVVLGRLMPPGRGSSRLAMPTSASLAALDLRRQADSCAH
jgi:hypothetical protein